MVDTFRIEAGRAWVAVRRLPEITRVTVVDRTFPVPKTAAPGGQFLSYHRREFVVPHENGWTVKITWQSMDRHDGEAHAFPEETATADVTIFDRDDRCVVWDDTGRPLGRSLDHNGIRSSVATGDVLAILDEVPGWPSDHLPILDRT